MLNPVGTMSLLRSSLHKGGKLYVIMSVCRSVPLCINSSHGFSFRRNTAAEKRVILWHHHRCRNVGDSDSQSDNGYCCSVTGRYQSRLLWNTCHGIIKTQVAIKRIVIIYAYCNFMYITARTTIRLPVNGRAYTHTHTHHTHTPVSYTHLDVYKRQT